METKIKPEGTQWWINSKVNILRKIEGGVQTREKDSKESGRSREQVKKMVGILGEKPRGGLIGPETHAWRWGRQVQTAGGSPGALEDGYCESELQVGEDVRLDPASGDGTGCGLSGKQPGGSSNPGTWSVQTPGASTRGTHARTENYIHTKACTCTLIAALFTITKKKPKYASPDNKIRNVCKMEDVRLLTGMKYGPRDWLLQTEH